MRRTYRSKKDTGSCIDHRDVAFSTDATTSRFNAFYIENLKQMKREMSSVGTSNPYRAASNKVRKRKYVKRLKESEPLRESLSSSVYLTPDKSIHVNKAPDLFDQLLNSSTNVLLPKSTSNVSVSHNVQQSNKPGRTYCRKKLTKIKKFNKSSSESSDSDKENVSDESNVSINTSNIQGHKLLIEKDKVCSPCYLDDSIVKIAKRLPVLSKLSNESEFELINRSSTINNSQGSFILSPLKNSPQCSTPFHEKYRGKSIYYFSPINKTRATLAKNMFSVGENKSNDTFVCMEKHDVLFQNSDNNVADNNTSKTKISEVMGEKDIENILDNDLQKEQSDCEIILPNNSIRKEILLSEEEPTSSLQVTDCEPFYGFHANTESEFVNLERYKNYFADNGTTYNNDSIQTLRELSNCEPNMITNSVEYVNTSNCVDSENESVEIFVNSENIKSESVYDTCDSDNISDLSLSEVVETKEAVVLLEKINDSIFQKYLENMPDYSLNNSNNEVHNESSIIYESDYASFEDQESNYKMNLSEASIIANSDINILSSENFNVSNTKNQMSFESEDSDCDEIDEAERSISFVTTRKRNEITNDSFLLLENSFATTSSATLDDTVISYREERLEKSDIIENRTLVMESEDNVIKNHLEDDESNVSNTLPSEYELVQQIEPVHLVHNEERANINTRDSSRMYRDSMNRYSQIHDDENCGLKQGIVLKPGKKWERSLSIYRRMTAAGDCFDRTVFDEGSIKTKGRKYRQSVISTMEMQSNAGSLYNDSVISRRSTFVAKPTRSTIKIFKDPDVSRVSLCSSVLFDDLQGFWNDDCDDTIIELSKLSIGDAEHEVARIEKLHDTSDRIVTARDYVLRRCDQTEPILFDECYPDSDLKNCRKIGEGVYGEVFLWRAGDGRARVMKIVPIAGAVKVNGEEQKAYHEIISEIVIAMELSALRAPIAEIERHFDEGKEIDALDLHSVQNATDVFNEVLAVRCVYGPYPSRLLDLWELYDECKGSENDNPAALPAGQHYLVLELANAGQDLESYCFNNAEQAYALFKQIALGLAVAEEELQFEHRDLHWGNVLIAPTDQKWATFVLRGRAHRTARCGVAATVIDYSLSRCARAGSVALYNDLAADEALFDAVGDYQFDVYRLMRDKLGNEWQNFEPYTNILWLHYTVDKMITALRYTRTNTKIHKHYIAKLKDIKNRILDYGSATQLVLTDNEF